MERTYIMLKPDALQRGIAGQIIARIERKGYRITHMKTMQLDEAILREHYAHIVDKPFFPPTVDYMTSGPVIAMVVEGENVIGGMRTLMGPTRNEDAMPGTIRGDFASWRCTSPSPISTSCVTAAKSPAKRPARRDSAARMWIRSIFSKLNA